MSSIAAVSEAAAGQLAGCIAYSTEVLQARTTRQHDHTTGCTQRCAVPRVARVAVSGCCTASSLKVIPRKLLRECANHARTAAIRWPCPVYRVLTSERWTGKTLGDHKADRLEFVRQRLAAVGIDKPARDPRRYTWATITSGTRVAPRAQLLMAAIAERIGWRGECERAILAGRTLHDNTEP